MKTIFILSVVLAFGFAGCEDKEEKSELSGFNIKGEAVSCAPMLEGKTCTEVFTSEDRFANQCRAEGHEVIQCDCHKFLCDTKDGKPLKFNE